jgi:hypothetical protein
VRSAVQQSGSLFDAIGERLSSLIHRFDVEKDRGLIQDAYSLLCRESLNQDTRSLPLEFSRINTDGTPIQFSLSLADTRPTPLQFLAEPGAPGSTIGQRISIGVDTMRALASLFGAADELAATDELRERMAPELNPKLNQDRSGVYWLGLSFPPGGAPALTTYINSKWGDDEERWDRTRAFAAWFGVEESWQRIEQRLRPSMAPLGTAITISRGRPPSGRMYTSAYGLPLEYFSSLLGGFCAKFTEELLGEECAYPLRSAVCSYEVRKATGIVGSKFELCGHCAFSSDAEASAKVSDWLRKGNRYEALYSDTLQILQAGGALSAKLPEVHAYVGVGVRGGEIYSSVYLNPGPPVRAE